MTPCATARKNRIARCVWLCAVALAPAGCEKPAPTPPDNSGYVKPDVEKPFEPRILTTGGVRWVDITREAGIDFLHVTGASGNKWMPETVGGGGGFVDYDGDGHADILLVNSCEWTEEPSAAHRSSPRLYRNAGNGKFEDVTVSTGLDAVLFYGMGFCAADYDGDGDVDLFLTGVGRSILLVRQGEHYVDRSAERLRFADDAQSGTRGDWSLGAAWFDADGDGDLDLFVCNYVDWSPETDVYTTLDGRTKSYATPVVYEGRTNRLFENRGGGLLIEVTREAGLYNPKAKSMGVVVDDFDRDGRPDLFITNDTERNLLYLNRGGRFEEVGLAAGCAYDEDGRARAGMGVDTADITNDGDLCIAIGNFSREPLSLYQRRPDGLLFVDAASRARLSRPTLQSLTFGVLFFDADLDGFVDLAVANGHIEPEINRTQSEITFAQPPQLFLNQRDGTFFDATVAGGEDFSRPMVGRALACADIDGDGDLDLLITENGGRPRLLRNERIRTAHPESEPDSAPHWLRVRLISQSPNHEAIGATIRVTAEGGPPQIRRIRTGGSYLSQSERIATFGLNAAEAADVEVTWPDGSRTRFEQLSAGRLHVLSQFDLAGN